MNSEHYVFNFKRQLCCYLLTTNVMVPPSHDAGPHTTLCAHYQFYDSGMAANGFGTWRYSVTYRNLIVWLNGIRRGGLNMSKRILVRAGSIRKPIHVITPELSFSRPPIVWMLSGVRILF